MTTKPCLNVFPHPGHLSSEYDDCPGVTRDPAEDFTVHESFGGGLELECPHGCVDFPGFPNATELCSLLDAARDHLHTQHPTEATS